VRAGLFALCERNGVAYEVSLADVVFAAGSTANALVARYRTWLGLAPPTGSAASRSHLLMAAGSRRILTGESVDRQQTRIGELAAVLSLRNADPRPQAVLFAN
jgi:hypothetical protein